MMDEQHDDWVQVKGLVDKIAEELRLRKIKARQAEADRWKCSDCEDKDAEIAELKAVLKAITSSKEWWMHNPSLDVYNCVFCDGKSGATPADISHHDDCPVKRANELIGGEGWQTP